MDMIEIRRRMLMVSRKRLPSAYQEVEYIEGTGTQYIDINNTAKHYNFDIVISITVPTVISSNMFCGMSLYSDAASWCLFWNNSTAVVRRRNNSERFDASVSLSTVANKKTRYIWNQEKAAVLDENENVIAENNTLTNHPQSINYVRLFRGVSNSKLYEKPVAAKVYAYKAYNSNGLLKYDLIPCYRKSDGEIGVFDLVGKQFYANSGTGTFLKGADV